MYIYIIIQKTLSMKISYISDLHFESNPSFELINKDNSDVLILAGDIIIHNEFDKFKFWFDDINKKWKHIIYVKGNHELYGSDISQYTINMETIDDVHFINLTYFPKMTNFEQCMQLTDICYIDMNGCYSTFGSLRNSRSQLTHVFMKKINYVNSHTDWYLSKILNELDKNDKIIITTHFSPDLACMIGYKYPEHQYFHRLMRQSIIESIQNKVDYWIYGHTHYNRDFEKYGVKFITNQCSTQVKTFEI